MGKIPFYLLDENLRIPGTSIQSAECESGLIIIQHVMIGSAKLNYVIAKMNKTGEFFFSLGKSACSIITSLHGMWHFKISRFGRLSLCENHVNIIHGNNLDGSIFLEERKECKLLLIEYETKDCLEKFSVFPSLEKYHMQLSKKISFLLFDSPQLVTAVMADAFYQLAQSTYYPSPRNFHIQLVHQLLSSVCEQAAAQSPQTIRFGIDEIEALHAAKLLIDQHLGIHYTIEEIAHKVGINRQKLRVGFKDLFGKGLYEYLLNQRLINAKIQLEQSHKPIKEIARIAGYHNTSNFCTAFKRSFGVTPKLVRQK